MSTLPVHEEALRAPATVPRRILIIDDDDDSAHTTSEVLVQLGHEVAVAHDGPVALTVARAFQPEVVMVDINLPVLDGWDLALRLRQLLGADARLVALTGRTDSSDAERSRSVGFEAHLVKPLTVEKLQQIL